VVLIIFNQASYSSASRSCNKILGMLIMDDATKLLVELLVALVAQSPSYLLLTHLLFCFLLFPDFSLVQTKNQQQEHK